MKLQLTPTIIFLLLILFIIVIIMWNLFFKKEERQQGQQGHEKKEGFIQFQYNNSKNLVYIPQYSSNADKKVYSIHDNIFFDPRNGNLIEVDGTANTSSQSNDITGMTIQNLYISNRDGRSTKTIPSQPLIGGSVIPYDTDESKISSLLSNYSNFTYTTKSCNTDRYQAFYIGFDKSTYIHIIDISGTDIGPSSTSEKGSNVISCLFQNNDLVGNTSYSSTATNNLPSMNSTSSHVNTSADNNRTSVNAQYYNNKYPVYQITPYVKYDYKNGYILIKNTDSNTTSSQPYIIYNRTSTTPISLTSTPPGEIDLTPSFTSYTISDNNNGCVLVITYKYGTVIGVITADSSSPKYDMNFCVKFDQNGVATTSTDTSGNRRTTDTSGNRNRDLSCNKVCGDDLSCKWYWYFHTLGGGDVNTCSGKDKYFNEDYILKTELGPLEMGDSRYPGEDDDLNEYYGGDYNINHHNYRNGRRDSSENRLDSSGNRTDSSGNRTDSSGNRIDSSGNRIDSSGNRTDSSRNRLSLGRGIGTTMGSGATAQGSGWSSIMGNGTFSSNANPDTLGGSSTLMTYATVAGIEGVALTAGNVVNKTVDTAGNIVYKITDAAGNVVNRTFDAAGNLINGSIDLVKGAGSGLANIFKSPNGASVNSPGGIGGVSSWQNPVSQVTAIGAQNSDGPGTISDSTFGNMPGSQTPIDNYSYFGALQSKGANYMPITSDFSSFRK